MNKKVFIVLHCIYLSCSGNPEVKYCGRRLLTKRWGKIVGGVEASPADYPWMVSLQADEGEEEVAFEHICGASVLNENWLITAAHCMYYYDPSMFQGVAGLHKLSDLSGSKVQIIKISKIVKHSDYDTLPTMINDIALLKTAKPIDIVGSKYYVNSICLPRNQSDPTGNATVIGWGLTSKNGEGTDALRKVDVPIVPRDVCKDLYGNGETDQIAETLICAGMENKDACQMDSGGPLFQTTSNGVSTLIGMVSYGRGCGGPVYPGVYTKVSHYLPWIEEVIAEN